MPLFIDAEGLKLAALIFLASAYAARTRSSGVILAILVTCSGSGGPTEERPRSVDAARACEGCWEVDRWVDAGFC